MFIALVVLTALLVLGLLGSAVAKLTRNADLMSTMEKVEFPLHLVPLLAMAEIAGAVGLVVGFLWRPIGIAAAVGVLLYFVGAVVAHLRKGDRQIAGAAVFLALSGAVLGLVLAVG